MLFYGTGMLLSISDESDDPESDNPSDNLDLFNGSGTGTPSCSSA